MKRTIHRDLVFTAAEVQDALVYMLRERHSAATPSDKADVAFKLSEHGASLAWTEHADDD